MNTEKLLMDLKQLSEMDPDKHDGSYELMREIVASYAMLPDLSVCDYYDLNAVYAMALGTWKLNMEKKKEYVELGYLTDNEKMRMTRIIDRVWNNACHDMYENKEVYKKQNRISVGMFGSGFYSFVNKTTIGFKRM